MKRFFTFIAVIFFSANLFGQTTVTFNVDLTDTIASGWFIVGTDDVYMAGDIFDPAWSQPGTDAQTLMSDADGDGIYTLTLSDVADGDYAFKYFKATSGSPSWDNGEWAGDPNRTLTLPVAGKGSVTVNYVFGDVNAQTVGIKDIDNISININPNPSTGIFKLSKDADFEVVDLTGKIVLSGKNNIINLTNCVPGMYIVRLSTNEGIALKKLIVK